MKRIMTPAMYAARKASRCETVTLGQLLEWCLYKHEQVALVAPYLMTAEDLTLVLEQDDDEWDFLVFDGGILWDSEQRAFYYEGNDDAGGGPDCKLVRVQLHIDSKFQVC